MKEVPGCRVGAHGEYELCVPPRPFLWEGGNGKTWSQKALVASADGYGRIEVELADMRIAVFESIVSVKTGTSLDGGQLASSP